jgi:hypothetical protein
MSSNTTSRFYVMLMPNDGYLVREEGDDILSTERDALDCWIVEATGKKHALAITLHQALQCTACIRSYRTACKNKEAR